jgi:hypothetical protein
VALADRGLKSPAGESVPHELRRIIVDADGRVRIIDAMKALSIRQPWAWLILHAGKDIENRNWQPSNPGLHFRGTCLIHAGIALQPIGDELRSFVKRVAGVDLPPPGELPRGGIVGQVDVLDVVRTSLSSWFEGPCGLVLANAKPLPFRACRGRLGFFRPFGEALGDESPASPQAIFLLGNDCAN